MEAEIFVKMIGENHTVNIRGVSDKIDKLSARDKATLCNLNDYITNFLCDHVDDPKNHLIAAESLLVTIKYSLAKLGYLK